MSIDDLAHSCLNDVCTNGATLRYVALGTKLEGAHIDDKLHLLCLTYDNVVKKMNPARSAAAR